MQQSQLNNIYCFRKAFECTWSNGLNIAKQGLIACQKRTSQLKTQRHATETTPTRKSPRQKSHLKRRILDKVHLLYITTSVWGKQHLGEIMFFPLKVRENLFNLGIKLSTNVLVKTKKNVFLLNYAANLLLFSAC